MRAAGDRDVIVRQSRTRIRAPRVAAVAASRHGCCEKVLTTDRRTVGEPRDRRLLARTTDAHSACSPPTCQLSHSTGMPPPPTAPCSWTDGVLFRLKKLFSRFENRLLVGADAGRA